MTRPDALTEDFARQFPGEFAATLGSEPSAVVLEVLGNLPASLVIPIAARLPQSHFVEFLLRDAGLLRDWLAATEIDQALMFVGRMSRHQAIALIEGVENPKLARRLMRAIRYPEHCVGAVMSVKLRRIDSNLTLEQMLTDLRTSRDPGSPPAVVLDERGRYLGKLDPWKVLLRGASVEKSADCLQKVEPLLPEMTIISARQAPQWEQHHWLPVADQKGRILGAVSRSALDEAETTPDELLIEGLAGAGSMLIRVFAALMERLLVRKLVP